MFISIKIGKLMITERTILKTVFTLTSAYLTKAGIEGFMDNKRIDADKEANLKRIESENKRIETENKRIETENKRIETENKRIEADKEVALKKIEADIKKIEADKETALKKIEADLHCHQSK